jgi:hypothetical protein
MLSLICIHGARPWPALTPQAIRGNFPLQNLSISWTIPLTAGAPDSVPQVLGLRQLPLIARWIRFSGLPVRIVTAFQRAPRHLFRSGQKESVSEEALCW